MPPFLFRSLLLATPFVALCIADCRADFAKDVRPLIEEQCLKCHGGKKQKGGVNLASFLNEGTVLKKHKLWRTVLEQVQNGDMPPEEETPLAPAARAKMIGGIQATLALLESDHPSLRDPGPGIIRRLSRAEYSNTVHDLLGIEFEAREAAGMPEDNTGLGYANLATALTVAPELMEKYFVGADTIVERLLAARDPAAKDKPGAKKDQLKKDKAAADALLAGLPGAGAERDAAQAWLTKTMRRAFRRPVAAAESGRYLKLFDLCRSHGDDFPTAALRLLKPLLVSPEFLFRIEGGGAASGATPRRVTDLEMASRLSYFLWSTMPDETLLGLAEKNELSKPGVLETQVRRMLADERAKALTENFAAQWLQLDRLATARPSTEFFPTFNDDLKKAMRAETVTFIDKLREEDRSVLELLASDYTYVNEALAKHYGLQGVTGKELRRISLKPENHRGGLLGMGSVLALNSHTNRTSPTQRGKWVLEVIFGTPPAPPPANAGMFKDEKKTKEPKDFREKLAQHASDATCAGCHKKIDPLGFGLENYNAVGEWRASSGDVDASGQLPGGEKFNGADELRKIIWNRRDQFLRNVISETLTYALGRQLDYYDVNQVVKIKATMEKNGYRFSDLVLGIVNSFPFQYRRDADPASAAAPAQTTAAN